MGRHLHRSWTGVGLARVEREHVRKALLSRYTTIQVMLHLTTYVFHFEI